MRPRFCATAGNLLLALVSTAMGLLILEGLARLELRYRGGGKEEGEAALYMESDPVLGWRKRPGARVTYSRREYRVDVKINSLGQRDPERCYQKPAHVFRVLALGDSFIEGYSVPLEETVTQRLEARLSAPGCPVEVLNAGTAAYGTDQEYLFYRTDGRRYAPDVVLVFFYFNDLIANTVSRSYGAPKPRLVSRDGDLVQANYPLPPLPKRPRPEEQDSTDVEGSAAFAFLQERLLFGAPRTYNALARLGLWEPIGGDQEEPSMRVFKRRRQAPVEAAWDITDSILRALSKAAADDRARFAVVYVPSRMEVDDRDWELTRLRFEWNQAWDRGLVAERLAELAAHAGFPLLDLTEPLRAAERDSRSATYYLHDGHWNGRGHATAATAVLAFLRARGWLPACARGEPRHAAR
jgi:hypothetical protein